MALDKFYGTSDKLKSFIDLCHQNCRYFDVALNHAFGRNQCWMWMNDPTVTDGVRHQLKALILILRRDTVIT
jgi:1,4-alpha-glucan branching enzyme